MNTVALIVAAGAGARFGLGRDSIPKQYIDINGCSVLENSIRVFASNARIDKIQVVIAAKHQHLYKSYNNEKLLPVVLGSDKRQDSVYNGLEALKEYNPKFVLIHDGVRPFVSQKLIDDVITALQANVVVVPVLMVYDAVLKVSNGLVTQYIDRNVMRKVQTPQGFDFASIISCYESEEDSCEVFNDDGSVMHKYNVPVTTIPGEEKNIKITVQDDLKNV